MPHPPIQTVTLSRGPLDRSRELYIRPLASDADYAACEALQHATWGEGFAEVASASMMRLSQKVGGLSAGAFDHQGEIVGCIFGFTGLRDGKPLHWSHLMAVHSDLRGCGLGRHLKLYQRDFLLEMGVEVALWTYDPLVSRNAHLNLHRLGAEPIEYHEDFYGSGDQNELHRGIGTDRFIVEWRLRDPHVEQAISGELEVTEGWPEAPVVNVDPDGEPLDGEFALPEVDVARIEVPGDIQAVKDSCLETAVRWRRSTRRALSGYMSRGLRVRDLISDASGGHRRYFYVLA